MDQEVMEQLRWYLYKLIQAVEKIGYELHDKESCPNSFNVFDKACQNCPYGDVCRRDED